MARLAWGDPDFLSWVASGFKAVAPILSTAASFIPIVGPIASRAIDAAAGMVKDDDSLPNNADDDEA